MSLCLWDWSMLLSLSLIAVFTPTKVWHSMPGSYIWQTNAPGICIVLGNFNAVHGSDWAGYKISISPYGLGADFSSENHSGKGKGLVGIVPTSVASCCSGKVSVYSSLIPFTQACWGAWSFLSGRGKGIVRIVATTVASYCVVYRGKCLTQYIVNRYGRFLELGKFWHGLLV